MEPRKLEPKKLSLNIIIFIIYNLVAGEPPPDQQYTEAPRAGCAGVPALQVLLRGRRGVGEGRERIRQLLQVYNLFKRF